ncbi:MAG: outer membrane beta-barrel protein [Ignavibacteria bacterium]|nr:outer membrane beta-barrel protein [Ignavibacteria bacterium]
MYLRLTAFLLSAFFVLTSIQAQIGTHFSTTGGVSFPQAEDSDLWNTGYTVKTDGFFKVADNCYLGFRIGYTWSTVNEEKFMDEVVPSFDGNVELSGYLQHGEIMPSFRYIFNDSESSSIKFYGQAGAGFYYTRRNWSYSGEYHSGMSRSYIWKADAMNESSAGIDLSAGVMFEVFDGFGVVVYPMYHVIFNDSEDKMLSLNLGIVY